MAEPSQAATLTDVREQLKKILRRDLKLGPDVPIADDMPLFNSAADLDSLDMLLLVSSVEREFGFRIPNESLGEAVFRSVDTLANYVYQNRGPAGGGKTAASPTGDVLKYLPHGEPFRFVSALLERKPGESAIGEWKLSGDEAFFKGHFPGRPLVPGVLIAEALAQISGLVAAERPASGMLVQVDVRFEKPVAPPAVIKLRSRAMTKVGALHQFEVSAEANGQNVVKGTLSLHLSGEEK
jgi:3-hydroxyacyl-[acyl-carrier-protein] dehydratase